MFEYFVGLRYLMTKRDRNMLSVITLISVGGVAVGVMALIVVLSIMSGFEADLKSKIIGTKAHIVISSRDGYVDDYEKIAKEVKTVPKVLGASPFVETEVMINSATNLQGIILRGIDTRTIDSVSDFSKQIVNGELSYLDNPDALPGIAELGGYSERSGALTLQSDVEDGPLDAETVAKLEKAGAKAAVAFVGGDHGEWLAKVAAGEAEGITESAGSVVENAQVFDDFGDFDDDEHWVGDMPTEDVATPCAPDERCVHAIMRPRTKIRTMKAMDGMAESDDFLRSLPAVMVGSELKKNLGLFQGLQVNLMSPTGDVGPAGSLPKSRPFKVVGHYHSGMYEYDTKMAYISLSAAQQLLNIGNKATGIDIKISDFEKSHEVVRVLKDKFADRADLKIDDWKTLNGSLFGALLLEKIAMFTILTFIILVASFGILCLLIMMVIEKGREIAIFKSMGATNASVIKIFVVQGAIIGALGMIIGTLLGLLLCYLISVLGIKPPGEVYYMAQIPVHIDWLEIFLIDMAAMGISLLATVVPSYMAARLDPVDGLRLE